MTGILLTQTTEVTGIRRLTEVNLNFTAATFYGCSAFSSIGVPTINATNLYFGFESGRHPYELTPGSYISITYPAQMPQNLRNIFVTLESGDGIYVFADK